MRHTNDRATALELFEGNRGLAFHLAGKFRRRAADLRLDFEDIQQSALVGLWKAAHVWDAQRGLEFSTLAYRCVLNELLRLFQKLDRWGKPTSASAIDAVFEQLTGSVAPNPDARLDLEEALRQLPEREAIAVRECYGVCGATEDTLKDIGTRLGCTKERARQLKNEGLRRLAMCRGLACSA